MCQKRRKGSQFGKKSEEWHKIEVQSCKKGEKGHLRNCIVRFKGCFKYGKTYYIYQDCTYLVGCIIIHVDGVHRSFYLNWQI